MNRRSVLPFVSSVSLLALGACSPPPVTDSGVDAAADSAPLDVTSDMPQSDVTDVTDVTAPSDAADVATDVNAPTDVVADGGGPSCPLTRVIATTTDGTEGAYVTGTIADRSLAYLPPPMGARVEQDHVVRRAGCRVYDLWRPFGAGGNDIVELDPANPYTPRRRIAVPPVPSVGAPNPYDVVEITPTKSYLVLYNSPSLWVFNPQTGAMSGSVDLSAYAGSDGIPEASMIHVANGRAWVALQQLDRMAGYAPPARSTIVAIDTSTDQPADLDAAMAGVQATISLNYGNPQSSTVASAGRLWLIASSGTFTNPMDGGIDVLDTMTGRLAGSFSAAMLGADPGSLTMVGPTLAWVATRVRQDAGSRTSVRVLDLTGMLVTASPALERPEPLSDLQLGPDGNVWALNGSFGASGAVYVFRPDGTTLSTYTLPPRADAGAAGTYSLAFAP